MQLISRTIHSHILKAEKIVIVPHQNPDEDAIGAATALLEYLTTLNKEAVIFCVTPVNTRLNFIPHSRQVTMDATVLNNSEVDTIITVDSGDLRYAGVDKLLANHQATIINIDHHATNERFGEINLVIPTAASTTEILFHYFKHNHIAISAPMATSLLAGLTADTGVFTNSATSATALAVGGELIRCGGNYNIINTATIKNKSIETLRLWGKVLSRLSWDESSGITHTFITRNDLEEHKVGEAESEGIANFLNNLENSGIALLLRETDDGKVKGSFRTTQNDIDVSALAKTLGGGGHKKAAGFTASGTIAEVLNQILTKK